jgi:preprotein translocase subunit SecG
MGSFVAFLLMFFLLATATVLIVLVLIQRGKGGGLAGAFGGMGGQSAFGTKAGDLFTKITIGLACFWIILCVIAVKAMSVPTEGPLGQLGPKPNAAAPAAPGKQAPAKTPAPTTPAKQEKK